MFQYQRQDMKVPAYVWLSEEEYWADSGMVEQVENIARLPFAFHHVVLAPDGHQGFGMPIGGVLATKDAIIPNAVGVDIGCGVCFIQTDIPADILRKRTESSVVAEKLVGQVLQAVPTGFAHHKQRQPSRVLDNACVPSVPELDEEIKEGYYQIGTLGGGNHFIEWQEDDEGLLAIMVHSGSRNFGYKVCRHFNAVARHLAEKWNAGESLKRDLAFLPLDSQEGQQYLAWMELAQRFARENRETIMERVVEITAEVVGRYSSIDSSKFGSSLDVHHNYAAFETHFGKRVIVHRKGTIRAGKDESGIIPGAMGSNSYLVKGKGNENSFLSCSHGAGRRMGRKEALRTFSAGEVVEDLKTSGVVLGKVKKGDVAEEARFAYKDIDAVIAAELDLITPVKRLRTVAVVKG